ncbi:MAG: hypothetical protein JWQ48_198 [Conexibacter sp.]|nr:hypothetical protein [Conexibacter sp.]
MAEDILAKLRRITQQRARLDIARDAAIHQAFAEGHTGPEIAEATGLTKSRVHQISRAAKR